MREHVRNTKPVAALAPAVRAGSATGPTIDRFGFDSLSFLVLTGAYTDGTHTLVAEESDDGTNFVAVPAASLTAALPLVDGAGKANQASLVGYIGDARYVRLKSNVSGSPATGAAIGATVLLGKARNRPTGSGIA